MAATQLQKQLVQEFKSNLFDKVRASVAKSYEYFKAVVKLPHKNEDGDSVVHSDNKEMLVLMELYQQEAQVWLSCLSREDQNRISAEFPNWQLGFVKPENR